MNSLDKLLCDRTTFGSQNSLLGHHNVLFDKIAQVLTEFCDFFFSRLLLPLPADWSMFLVNVCLPIPFDVMSTLFS